MKDAFASKQRLNLAIADTASDTATAPHLTQSDLDAMRRTSILPWHDGSLLSRSVRNFPQLAHPRRSATSAITAGVGGRADYTYSL